MRHTDLLLGAVLMLALAVLLQAVSAEGRELYLGAGAGVAIQEGASGNDSDLEIGQPAAPLLALEGGVRGSLGRLALALEHDLGHEIHGVNGAGCDQRSCSGDDVPGNTLAVTSLSALALPEVRFGRWALYAGGGPGVAVLQGLEDTDVRPMAQARAGVTLDVGQVTFDLGAGAAHVFGGELAGQDVEYTRLVPAMLHILWRF